MSRVWPAGEAPEQHIRNALQLLADGTPCVGGTQIGFDRRTLSAVRTRLRRAIEQLEAAERASEADVEAQAKEFERQERERTLNTVLPLTPLTQPTQPESAA